jgi:hypothetical protein
MIELIVLASIQVTIWGSIGVYKMVKYIKGRCNRQTDNDNDSYEFYDASYRRVNILNDYKNDYKNDLLPMYVSELPDYDDLPPVYIE